jgi:hypothetical protein
MSLGLENINICYMQLYMANKKLREMSADQFKKIKAYYM